MKILITILFVLLLSGCNTFHEKPLPASEATDIDLKIQWVESFSELPAYARNLRGDVRGYSVWVSNAEGKRLCTIWAVKPYNVDDFKNLNSLGHELLHCTDGHFHGAERSKDGSDHISEVLNRP